jgi:sugar phosphate isomerase/epimerase
VPRLAAFPKGFFADLVSGQMSVFQWIDQAGTLGLDGIELYPAFLTSFDPRYLGRVREAAASQGLEIPMLCHSPDFTQPDADARGREVDRARHMLRVTADLGGRWCRVLSGQNRPGLDEREALGWVIASIETLIPEAESARVVLALENHYKDGLWEYPEFAQSERRYLGILEAIDSPWLGAQYDPSNAVVAGEDPYALLQRIVPRMVTMHASDRYLEGGTIADLRRQGSDPMHGYAKILKHGVIGEGLNDYDRIFETLAAARYRGWISIEDGEGPTIAEGLANLSRSVAFLRGQFAQHFREDP